MAIHCCDEQNPNGWLCRFREGLNWFEAFGLYSLRDSYQSLKFYLESLYESHTCKVVERREAVDHLLLDLSER